jgi:uncharacterized membrane protein YesL
MDRTEAILSTIGLCLAFSGLFPLICVLTPIVVTFWVRRHFDVETFHDYDELFKKVWIGEAILFLALSVILLFLGLYRWMAVCLTLCGLSVMLRFTWGKNARNQPRETEE